MKSLQKGKKNPVFELHKCLGGVKQTPAAYTLTINGNGGTDYTVTFSGVQPGEYTIEEASGSSQVRKDKSDKRKRSR